MEIQKIYEIIRNIVLTLKQEDESFKPLPDEFLPESTLDALGLDLVTLPEILNELKARFSGKDIGLDNILYQDSLHTMTLGQMLESIKSALVPMVNSSLVVYVDDEEENLFVFKRKYGKRLNLKTFTEPKRALQFIVSSPDVTLVITDEVMPLLSGNELCDEVHKFKPNMKFILITGNPNSDGDLMYKSLKQNRFYDFINKPLDLERKGEEYFQLIQGILHFNW